MKNSWIENCNLRSINSIRPTSTPYIDEFLLSALSGHNTVWRKPGTNRIEEISVTNPPWAALSNFGNSLVAESALIIFLHLGSTFQRHLNLQTDP